MMISLVVAKASNGVIGKNNDLPWHLPDDMKFFMEKTMGHHVIMGRKNYESLPAKYKPLPRRVNIVLTRNASFQAPGCHVVQDLPHAFDIAKKAGEEECMVIGGAEVYQIALPHAHRLYITEIHAEVEGDTQFPAFDPTEWEEVQRIPHPADEKHAYAFDFVTYKRKDE